MSYDAKILADSIADGVRLTTMEVTFPRFILAEFNTHRVFSRNSASSRAIPVEKRIAQVRENPFIPEGFTKNQRGMQASELIGDEHQANARHSWLRARDQAVLEAEFLACQGVHKQHANRLLEPFAWHTVVVSATEWENFFALRTDAAAQPEMQITAKAMLAAYEGRRPNPLGIDEWHLPFIDAADIWLAHMPEMDRVRISTARCARVSYLTHDGRRDEDADIALHDRLLASGHMSPFEHAAHVSDQRDGFIGNFRAPWWQYRKMLDGEAVWRGGAR